MPTTALDTIAADPASAEIYAGLLTDLAYLGPFEIEPKKTSLHITHGRAFLGVHPRKGALLLNLVLTEKIASKRIRKSERVSANRWHNELLVTSTEDLDAELGGWILAAYAATK